MKKKNVFQSGVLAVMVVLVSGFYSCKQNAKKEASDTQASEEVMAENTAPSYKLSLAQWSINRMIREEGVDPYKFAEMASDWGFEGLEYVSQLYYPELEKDNFSDAAMATFVEKCKAESEKFGLENLLIMIDGQGDLAAADEQVRKEAAENHHKWVDAAAALGCHSIRVNLNGTQDPEVWVPASIDGLTQLATYAMDKNINVIVENHGGPSSNAELLAEVIEKVGMDNCGTLPDFGNFCIKREAGDYYESKCVEEYDRYKGVEELMPYAKGVSAKSYDFDEAGKETTIDFARMIKIIEDSGYTGFIDVEYEGNELGEEEGILATKKLLEELL
ncbi:TIM barrel protein [Muricauda sp. CAU 1633]|uniref:sugar phosphate isomerase/epimerase family protein n=1 Tax=Allomuricauda sp. CAU 1633 TaxID=2816036 RepID=UPI001A8C8325|nr:sugar phosphate isomerase/epimerase family protein [Muricauda sp. CAU 1633]MBO0320809.1 TIM barrel protein [Muricauda sp. CAU 1633]